MSWRWWAVYCGSQGVSSSFLALHFQVHPLSIPLKILPLFSCPRQPLLLFLAQLSIPKWRDKKISLFLLLLSSCRTAAPNPQDGVGIEASSAFFGDPSKNYSLAYQGHLPPVSWVQQSLLLNSTGLSVRSKFPRNLFRRKQHSSQMSQDGTPGAAREMFVEVGNTGK